MSKAVEAHYKGQLMRRQGPTNRMSAAMSSGSPHSTLASISDRTERQATSEAADEATGTRTFSGKVRAMPRVRTVGASAAGTLLGRHRLDDQISVVRDIHRRCGKSERNLDQSADFGHVEIVG
jgi:hypothetical protein